MDPIDPTATGNSGLADISVLIIEDEYDVAKECAHTLERSGARVLGPASDIANAREIVTQEIPGCVLLDLNLKGEITFKFADELIGRGIPTIFTTGYDSSVLPLRLRNAPFLQKPIESQQFVRAIRAAVAPRKPKLA